MLNSTEAAQAQSQAQSRRVRPPLIATAIVVAAVATMIALGVWQLGRKSEKEALIARYEAALREPGLVDLPPPSGRQAALFRRVAIECRVVEAIAPISGKSARGRPGWVHIARCLDPAGAPIDVTIGWSRSPGSPAWSGGPVTGRIAPSGETVRIIAETPQASLEGLAAPDPGELPNNHLAYAGQWFFFAATALIIYVLALRRGRR